MMQLSPHFALAEFISPRDRGKPSQAVVNNLMRLCLKVLEPLRRKNDGPISVTSGWRSLLYNLRIGGALNSQHPKGTAADIEAISLDEQLDLIAWASQIPEVGGLGFYPGRGFIHVDIRPRFHNKITTWMQNSNKKYVSLPAHIRDMLRDHGAINLL